jgi:hypothetical protein
VRPRHALAGALLAVAVSCTGNDPALVAHLHVEAGSLSRCVVVVATNEDGGRDATLPRRVDAGESLNIGIFRGQLGDQVTVQAHGFASGSCGTLPDEQSERRVETFTSGAVPEFDLTLRGEGDCDDGQDGDGDGLVDCQDPACAGDPACADAGDAGDGGAPAGTFPYPPSNFSPGPLAVPDAGLIIDCDAGYDTGTRSGFLCGAANPPSYVLDGGTAGPVVLVAVSSLTITPTGRWTISGPNPLIVAVFGDAGIYGPLLGGAAGAEDGPGVRRPGCPGLGYEGLDGGNGGGGGGGAGYGRPGAHGAVGAGATPAAGGDGGLTFGTPELVPLRAGCSGGQGGVQNTVEPLAGGGGGGAIQLSAAGIVQVTSAIGVPGGGGRGATVSSNNGGGGGGSGGALLLEGRQLAFAGTARVTANGGAGGEGSDGSPSVNGEDGRVDGSFPALGGNVSPGLAGGDGGAGTVDATSGPDVTGSNFGGGGGGGGVGRIRLNAVQGCSFETSAAQVMSPPATSNRAGDAGCP